MLLQVVLLGLFGNAIEWTGDRGGNVMAGSSEVVGLVVVMRLVIEVVNGGAVVLGSEVFDGGVLVG